MENNETLETLARVQPRLQSTQTILHHHIIADLVSMDNAQIKQVLNDDAIAVLEHVYAAALEAGGYRICKVVGALLYGKKPA
jgi:hypothetical protein